MTWPCEITIRYCNGERVKRSKYRAANIVYELNAAKKDEKRVNEEIRSG